MTAYETDYFRWTQEQAHLLRQKMLSPDVLDIENIAEEIESGGRHERFILRRLVSDLILNLLKWRYIKEDRDSSWQYSIEDARDEIAHILKDSPSLQDALGEEIIPTGYLHSKKLFNRRYGVIGIQLPDVCPFTVNEIIDDCWPKDKGESQ